MAKKRVRLTDENDPLTQTDQVLQGIANLSVSDDRDEKSASQQADKSESQIVDLSKVSKGAEKHLRQSGSQQADTSEGQLVDKLVLRKATFQLSDEVLQALDRLHLKLQLDMGKANAPYKEVMVEEAIANFLADFEHKQEAKINSLTVRQNKR